MDIRRTIAIAARLVSFLPLFGQRFMVHTFPGAAADNAVGSKITGTAFRSENDLVNPGNTTNTDTTITEDGVASNFEIGESSGWMIRRTSSSTSTAWEELQINNAPNSTGKEK